MSDNSRVLKAAEAYVKAGYSIFPVSLTLANGEKNAQFPGKWSNSISDVSRIPELFTDATTGLIIDTGKSGIVALDIDVSKGKDGRGNLQAAGLELPQSPMWTTTWSKGRHLFFRQPSSPVGTGQNKPVSAVDFRGVGGCVYAAPTVVTDSATGAPIGTYEINRLVPVADLPVLPEEFATLLRPAKTLPRKEIEAPTPTGLIRSDQRAELERVIGFDLKIIRSAGDGKRNEVLGPATFRLADRCRKLGYEFEAYEALVLDAYRDSGGIDDKQALDWCRSSWAKSHDEHLTIPPTEVDQMAKELHKRKLADRIAKQKLNGEAARFVDNTSFVDWSVTPPEPKYWVKDVIPQGEQVVLFGEPEAGKTFLALDWSLSVATGRTTFGHSTTRGKVLYMSGEGNTLITSRIHAWMQHHKVQVDPEWFALTNHVPDLMNDQVMEALARRVADSEFDLVFIDTLSRAMAVGGGDISIPADTSIALKNLQVLSKYRPSATPVVIHHPIKSGSMAGAYSLRAGVDVALFASRDPETREGTLTFDKRKDGNGSGVIQHYRWHPQGISAVVVPGGERELPMPERRGRETHGHPFD